MSTARMSLKKFCWGHLNHLEERSSIRKYPISNFQNSQKSTEREWISNMRVTS